MSQSNFIFNEIDKDIASGVYDKDRIMTRFPPEPNGYLHIGHAKAIFINFSVKEKYHGTTNLRFDDTNPVKEDTEYTEAIQRDIAWLGYTWDQLFYASDYFGKMYEYALELIAKGLAFVDDQTAEEIKFTRGTEVTPGKPSPYRDRSVEENTELFEGMKAGKYKAGEKVLRAKIDMASSNFNMRDPVLYRIIYETHHNTKDEWCIYPMYDYAHPIEDAIEGITHSLCSIEFEDHRPFYDWLLKNLDDYAKHHPRQIEFARLNIENALTSKRYLKSLVDQGIVDAWDDPRLMTLCGLRRRGITPEAIREFCTEIGVSKALSTLSTEQLEYFVREDLSKISKRVMVVVDPIKLTITNFPEGEIEKLEVPYDMNDPAKGSRVMEFSKHLYIEAEDFMAEPSKKYYRLFVGNEVRLMGGYFVKCESYKTDENGKVVEVLCTYDPETKSGNQQRKVKSTIHWVSDTDKCELKTREFRELYNSQTNEINTDSIIERSSYGEQSLKGAGPEERFQFIRMGYFWQDSKYTSTDLPVYNRTVSLKSSFKPTKNA
jgi:glutaminyl-tRNA synthetase